MLQKGASGEGQVVQSRTGMFCKQGALRNFTKFTGKHLCQSLFFNKVEGLRKRLRCFPVNFAKFLRTPLFIEHLWWLLLKKKPQSHHGRICVTFKLEKQRLRGVSCIAKILLNSFWKTSRELLVVTLSVPICFNSFITEVPIYRNQSADLQGNGTQK